MKQLKTLSIFMLVALMAATFASCSKDDDNADFDLNRYIVGTWHSSKATVYFMGGEYAGESEEATISKTGQYSEAYYEMTFMDANRAKFGAFQKDENGLIHWEEEYVTYYVNGDVVKLRDDEGGTIDLVFDKKDRTLSLQISTIASDIPIKYVLYLTK